jgi:hypothetical protein
MQQAKTSKGFRILSLSLKVNKPTGELKKRQPYLPNGNERRPAIYGSIVLVGPLVRLERIPRPTCWIEQLGLLSTGNNNSQPANVI